MTARVAPLLLLLASAGSAVSAQTPQSAVPTVDDALVPGTDVWITDAAGREERTKIVGVSGGIVTVTAGEDVRRLRTTDVTRLRVRHSDTVLNGAAIGAAAAVASGLLVCRAMEPWENCRDDVGPLLTIGAIGAGIGVGIDALIRGRRTIYEAPPRAGLHAYPIVGRQGGGLQVSIDF